MKSAVMKIHTATLWLSLALIAVTSSIASSDRQTYIVRMDKTKITNTLDVSSKPWYQVILDSIVDDDVSSQAQQEMEATPPELLYSYETSFFGFAAKLSAKHLESLKKIDGFVAAIRDKMLSLHTTRSPQFLGLQGSRGLWHSSNLQSDVIIGVVDGGIWPEHASFQDHNMPPIPSRWKGTCERGTKFSPSNCNKKLIGARAFYKGYLANGGKINETKQYLSARDRNGHGTHTASTAAGNLVQHANLFGLANGSAAGMSYTARIAVYKVCWPGCSGVDILTATLQAIEDGVDVLSVSLGTSGADPYYEDVSAIAAFSAVENGIFASFSAGNFGPRESTVVNAAPWIMTVAASNMDRNFPAIVKLGNGQTFEGSSFYTGKGVKQLPIVYGKSAGGNGAEYCIAGSLNPKLVKGKIVICEKGKIAGARKGEHVKMAGGVGMLIISSEGEDLADTAHILPTALLGALASKGVKNYVTNTAKSPTASITFKGTTYGNRAPMVATFSSRGPNSVGPDVIKPDITAPGVNILAAWPAVSSPSMLESDNRRVLFNMISGTSMSCPHVSGIAALLKSKHKNWSPAAIKSALMTTAYTTDNRGKPIRDLAFYRSATPFAFGSGHVDPVKASDPGLIYDITPMNYIYYLCSLKYNASQMAMFIDDFTCPKKVTMQPGDLNYPSFAVNFESKSRNITTVTYKRTVTNVGIPRSTYRVSVEEPKGVSVIVRTNILRFKKLGEKLSYKVSFIGLIGGRKSGSSSFGSLVWVSRKYKVRSPVAVTWK